MDSELHTSHPGGERLCDADQPDFAQAVAADQWLSYDVRGQTYLVHSFVHTSAHTRAAQGMMRLFVIGHLLTRTALLMGYSGGMYITRRILT